MNRTYICISFILIVILLAGCDSENAFECFKKTGTIIEKEIYLEPFSRIIVMDEADIYLEPGEEQKVYVKAGKNIIQDIRFDVSGEILTISNENSCLWVREPGNPGIYITNPELRDIEIYDFVNFYTTDTISFEYLRIESEGTGNFDLKINADSLLVNTLYISNFSISGSVSNLKLRLIDDSRFDGKDLISNYIYIDHSGSNLVELFPVKSLSGQIRATGSIKYYHTPEIIDINIRGVGKLIDASSED